MLQVIARIHGAARRTTRKWLAGAVGWPHLPASSKGEIRGRGSDRTQERSKEASFLSARESLVLESDLLEPKKAQASRQDDARRSGHEQQNTCEKIHVSVDLCQPSTTPQRNSGALDRNLTPTRKEGRSALVQRQSAQFPREENMSQPNWAGHAQSV
jgi:hypothetical protein